MLIPPLAQGSSYTDDYMKWEMAEMTNSIKAKASVVRLRDFVLLLADCSTDCDCSKRCSLALTDWESTVASS